MLPDFVLSRGAQLARLSEADHGSDPRAWTALVQRRREQIRDSLGLDRLPRSGAVTVVDRVEKSGHTVEKIVFESIPGMPIPAFLYLPPGKGPHPAVVHPPGHWMEDARLAEPIQLLNQGLARSGIACLSYDTLGQGERRIGWHQHGQLAPLLVGITSLGVMVQDSLSAVDLLAARPDIDHRRIGMVGASGGAFSSIFASAIDERIRTTVVACIVNTHLGQLRDAALGTGWDGWVDLCNQVPRIFQIGGLGDILAMTAPRDLLVLNAEDDPPFPLAGSREVASVVRKHFAAHSAADKFSYVEVPGKHGFQPHVRNAATSFLVRHLIGDRSTTIEREQPWFAPRWPTPHNRATAERPQAFTPQGSEGTCLAAPVDSNAPLVAVARERATILRRGRRPLDRARLRAAVGPFPERAPLKFSVANHITLSDRHVQRLEVETEPGIAIDAVFSLPLNWSDQLAPVVVVLDEGGKSAALRSPEVSAAQAAGWAVLMPDLRGTGESAASEFEIATAAWMLDRDLLNQRVWDVLRLVDYLSERYSSSQQIDKGRIAIFGSGSFGLVALLAAALDDRIAGVGSAGPKSLEEWLTLNSAVSPMGYAHNLLETLDVPDLVEFIEPRSTTIGPFSAFTATLGWPERPPAHGSQESALQLDGNSDSLLT
jgi:cephalosporin-C deacetylase-like acetyl esterase